MADNQIVPVNPYKNGQPVFPPTAQTPTPQGPPVPPEILAAMHESPTPVAAQPPTVVDNTPPAPTNVPGLDAPQLTGINVPQGTPTLPPEISDLVQDESATGNGIPKRHKGVLEHIADFMPLVGMIGGAMEAAGDPSHPPVGAELLQHTLQGAAQRNLEREKMQNVDMPLAQAHSDYFRAAAPAKVAVAGINAGAKTQSTAIANRFKMTPGGLYDSQVGSLIPETTAGIMVTPEIAEQYQLPPEFVGKPMKLTDLAASQNAISRNLTTVQGAKGPALVNKIAGKGKDLGLGAPSVAARQAGVTDAEVDGKIVPMTDAQRLAQGAPRVSSTLAVGKTENKIFENAIDADTRLKQMYEQATDKTGASDMALLFNHIAMTGGNVKGLRMGSFLTEEHRKARSIPEDLGVLYNHLAAGEVLSPQQRVNFVRLAEQVRQSKWDAAQREGQLSGMNTPVTPDPDLPAIRSVSNPNRPTPPTSQKLPGAGVTIPVYHSGRQIGTATPEQQKRNTYTPIKPR